MKHNDNQIDLQRRRTLKRAVALTAGGAIAASPVATLASFEVSNGGTPHAQAHQAHSDFDKPLDEFVVEVRHQWQSNDIALVIRNRGDNSATITQLTPSQIELARGTLDVSSLLNNGPVTLAAGEELTVPLRHHHRNLNNSQAIVGGGHFDRSLQRQLRERMTIITDHSTLAAVTIAPGPRIA